MSGICQCMICGDLYYGDETDNWATCRCFPPKTEEEIAALRAEYDRMVEEDKEYCRKYHSPGKWTCPYCR